jgi:hypothetical protein
MFQITKILDLMTNLGLPIDLTPVQSFYFNLLIVRLLMIIKQVPNSIFLIPLSRIKVINNPVPINPKSANAESISYSTTTSSTRITAGRPAPGCQPGVLPMEWAITFT